MEVDGTQPLRLRARWVVPIEGPPIENGEVVVENGQIAAVGPVSGGPVSGEPVTGDVRDFGLAAILPGLVNVHAHIEYTVLRGLIEDVPFFPWIRTLMALKTTLTPEEWMASAILGAAEMAAAGITTVADASDAGAALTALIASGQRGIVFREAFGIEAAPSVETIVEELDAKIAAMRDEIARTPHAVGRISPGISPHAPYTVRPALFGALAAYARRNNLPQTIHLAETIAEADLIRSSTGPFAEMFARRGIAWEARGVSPIQHADACGALTPGTLAVHTVHIDAADAALLYARRATVAHCPKSNGKLAAGVAPLRTLIDAGVAVGLGTDSVVSNNNADIFEEMRFALFQARNQAHAVGALSARDALHLATWGGANALGMGDAIGTLTPGKRADLCIVRLDGPHIAPAGEDNPVAALVFGARASDVACTLVEGRVVYDAAAQDAGVYGAGRWRDTLNLTAARAAVAAARAKLHREAERIGSGSAA